ncbi:MAG: dienelactone hydrolase family protein [Rhodospirillales bacterium]|jgi:carboxymethylenebutenolidase|nr:dienelactone hydrolase family protein [Rhodospirillales bacterium]MDP6642525.1 dienelactone hydrolase family protein [Rhodospirillales bacterium]MDP6843438.1 dienelactone hydrolase family protein [Rhodospirillales bacterium]
MPSTDISYTTRADENFTGILSKPDGDGPFPGILMITAIFGIDEEMQELADAWAADGFVVSVPDIFWRVMPGPTADMEKAFGRYNDFDFDKGIEDVEDLIGDLRGRPECNGKVAVLGFCFGGRYAYLGASRFGADAAGAYHGTMIGAHLDEIGNVSCPVSFHFGDSDPVVPVEEVEAIKNAFAGRTNAEISLYEGAGHNFSMPYKEGYVAEAATASRAAVLSCFQSM